MEKKIRQNGKIKKIPQNFDPKEYLNYFIRECKIKEDEKTKASTTDETIINSIVGKKEEEMKWKLKIMRRTFIP